jgi:methyl-accepting chemotaxis protein
VKIGQLKLSQQVSALLGILGILNILWMLYAVSGVPDDMLTGLLISFLGITAIGAGLGYWLVNGLQLGMQRLGDEVTHLSESGYSVSPLPEYFRSYDMTVLFENLSQHRHILESLESDKRSVVDQRDYIQVAIDNVSQPLMFADAGGNIIFQNQAMKKQFFHNVEESVIEDKVLEVLSSIMAVNRQEELPGKQVQKLDFNGKIINVTFNPVFSKLEERVGCVMEWQDVTEQLEAEEQFSTLVQNASAGNLDSQLDSSHYSGFLSSLAVELNELLGTLNEPLKNVISVIHALSKGNLGQRMDGNYTGLFAELQEGVNESLSRLKGVLDEVQQAGHSIVEQVEVMAQTTQDISARIRSEAKELDKTAQELDGLTTTVRQNNNYAKQAGEWAEDAVDMAGKGRDAVGKAMNAMMHISDSSQQISDTIGVIDGISSQTNLLALNAAVEAARAGEQGKGFSVVAADVRVLSQKSAQASHEIRALIDDSVRQVGEGVKLVRRADERLREIVGANKKLCEVINEITSTSNEQTTGIGYIYEVVKHLDDATQRNTLLCDRAADSSEGIRGQMQHMEDLMGYFKVGNGEGDLSESGNESEEEGTACGVTIKSLGNVDETDQSTEV